MENWRKLRSTGVDWALGGYGCVQYGNQAKIMPEGRKFLRGVYGLWLILVGLGSGQVCVGWHGGRSQSGQAILTGSTWFEYRYFVRDSARQAYGLPQYDHLLQGAHGYAEVSGWWRQWHFRVRPEFYLNSNLIVPTEAYNEVGIPHWFLQYMWMDSSGTWELALSAGHHYLQFGEGLLFRTWNEPLLGIDNALVGLALRARVGNVQTVMFGGRIRHRFTTYPAFVKGLWLETTPLQGGVTLRTGGIFWSRTFPMDAMNTWVQQINTYPDSLQFIPRYNMYVGGGYLQVASSVFSLDIEGGMHTHDIQYTPNRQYLHNPQGWSGQCRLSVFAGRWTGTVGLRYIQAFDLRAQPEAVGTEGFLNYLPAFTRLLSYPLSAWYLPVATGYRELAFQADMYWMVSDVVNIEGHAARIYGNQTDTPTYQTVLVLGEWEMHDRWHLVLLFQYLFYDLKAYLGKVSVPLRGWVPLVQLTWRPPIRVASYSLWHKWTVQLLWTQQDMGSWLYGQWELGLSPVVSVFVSDAWNFQPVKSRALHYVSGGVSLEVLTGWKFQVGWYQQREGFQCAGGICRYEPAFHGLRLTVLGSM